MSKEQTEAEVGYLMSVAALARAHDDFWGALSAFRVLANKDNAGRLSETMDALDEKVEASREHWETYANEIEKERKRRRKEAIEKEAVAIPTED